MKYASLNHLQPSVPVRPVQGLFYLSFCFIVTLALSVVRMCAVPNTDVLCTVYCPMLFVFRRPSGSVGVAAGYGLEGPGIESAASVV
jgi:hypothetical protein